MKNIFFLLLLFHGCCSAQSVFIHDSAQLKVYEGTWQWKNGKEEFLLKLKMDTIRNDHPSSDTDKVYNVLYIWHEYRSGRKIVETDFSSYGNLRKSSGVGAILKDESTTSLSLMFYDYTRDWYFRIFFKLLNKEGNKAFWESWPQERSGGSGKTPAIAEGQTVPSMIILKKVTEK